MHSSSESTANASRMWVADRFKTRIAPLWLLGRSTGQRCGVPQPWAGSPCHRITGGTPVLRRCGAPQHMGGTPMLRFPRQLLQPLVRLRVPREPPLIAVELRRVRVASPAAPADAVGLVQQLVVHHELDDE